MKNFDINNQRIRTQFNDIQWIEESGVGETELKKMIDDFVSANSSLPRCIIKAKTYDTILRNSRIALDADDIFQDKLFGVGIILQQRYKWLVEVYHNELKEKNEEREAAYDTGCYSADSDFGHTSPNTQLLLDVGFTGLLDRINEFSSKGNLTQKQKDFYESCRIYLEAILHFIKRLAKAIEPYNKENSVALYNIANGKPNNSYEAMQLLVVYFFLHEFIGGTRVRTLGRLDVLLEPFYKNDIEKGTFTKAEIKEMIKFFFNKFWAANVANDVPLCLAGIDDSGREVTSELTYLLVETYNELDIHSPKIHIRVSKKTPADFVKLVLRCIRGGNSSFVFVNDEVTIKSLVGVGIKEHDAMNYVPIGCYEPAVWAKEIGCTGNGGVNLAKAIEFTITNGVDLKTGKQLSVKTGEINSYEEFISAVKEHICFMTNSALDQIREIEKYYGVIGPDPLLSAQYDRSVEIGLDVFEGGAEYNNTSYYFYFIASLIDSIAAVKKLVFDEKLVTFGELCEILKNNWEGNEKLRLKAKSIPEKYGNNNEFADALTKEFSELCASLVNNKPNSRGGVFKASIFSIDFFVYYGSKTMATPDGRFDGEVLSKNLCSTVGMDKNGVTALINSATKIDHSLFPNGTVLDVILHPSAVSGEDGLDAFYGLLIAYMQKGGMALHGNVFNPEDLKNAQKYPEKYKNLQVRVCGWNAYFVNLSKTEQDCFIKQSETTFL